MYRLIEAQKQKPRLPRLANFASGRGSRRWGSTSRTRCFPSGTCLLNSSLRRNWSNPSARTQKMAFSLERAGVRYHRFLAPGNGRFVKRRLRLLAPRPYGLHWCSSTSQSFTLHPELSHRLIRYCREIGARNQFVLSTHSPDVITASLDKSVIFIFVPSIRDQVASP